MLAGRLCVRNTFRHFFLDIVDGRLKRILIRFLVPELQRNPSSPTNNVFKSGCFIASSILSISKQHVSLALCITPILHLFLRAMRTLSVSFGFFCQLAVAGFFEAGGIIQNFRPFLKQVSMSIFLSS